MQDKPLPPRLVKGRAALRDRHQEKTILRLSLKRSPITLSAIIHLPKTSMRTQTLLHGSAQYRSATTSKLEYRLSKTEIAQHPVLRLVPPPLASRPSVEIDFRERSCSGSRPPIS